MPAPRRSDDRWPLRHTWFLARSASIAHLGAAGPAGWTGSSHEDADFLVIGAQKCGSTTLYHDLLSHPDVGCSRRRNAGLFTHDVLTAEDEAYLAAFERPGADKVVGEVATDYSMLPELDAVTRAREVLAP